MMLVSSFQSDGMNLCMIQYNRFFFSSQEQAGTFTENLQERETKKSAVRRAVPRRSRFRGESGFRRSSVLFLKDRVVFLFDFPEFPGGGVLCREADDHVDVVLTGCVRFGDSAAYKTGIPR